MLSYYYSVIALILWNKLYRVNDIPWLLFLESLPLLFIMTIVVIPSKKWSCCDLDTNIPELNVVYDAGSNFLNHDTLAWL